jgi:hypothetical protein
VTVPRSIDPQLINLHARDIRHRLSQVNPATDGAASRRSFRLRAVTFAPGAISDPAGLMYSGDVVVPPGLIW